VLGCRITASLLLAVTTSGVALAQTHPLDYYSQRIQSVTKVLVESVRPTLDQHARKVLDDIEFQSPLSWETNAEARRAFGHKRIVEFNAGFLAVTDWLALAMIADWSGHVGCLREYTAYLSELAGHNSRRLNKGRDTRHVHDFYSYASETRGNCAGALGDSIDEEYEQELRGEILDAVIATVVLHEIGHHVLDHVGGLETNFMQRRIREVMADRWAFNVAVDANYELRRAVPLFLFIAATGGGTLEDEIRSSHPSGLHRVRDLLVQTRALLSVKDPVGARLLDASIEDLNRNLR
jgi:hypothetical protein